MRHWIGIGALAVLAACAAAQREPPPKPFVGTRWQLVMELPLKGEQPKVLDFSVAKIPVGREHDDKEQARTDLIVGTPTYMSPEQAAGRPANELSDQYSIAALLYRCLTGRPPQGVLARLCDERPEILEEAVLERGLERHARHAAERGEAARRVGLQLGTAVAHAHRRVQGQREHDQEDGRQRDARADLHVELTVQQRPGLVERAATARRWSGAPSRRRPSSG